MAQCQGLHAQMVRRFFGIHLYWAEKIVKISQVQRAPRNINPGQAITWLVGVTI